MSNVFRSIGDEFQFRSAAETAAFNSGMAYLPDYAKPDYAKPDYAKSDCAKPDCAKPDYAEAEVHTAPLLEQLDLSQASVLVRESVCTRLDWEDLPRFAIVDRQFEQWGVVFANAVAVSPSNPAYPPYSGVMALMAAPKGGWLEATFLRPVKFVSSFVTSSRRTVLSAYDAENRLIASVETPAANLANSDSEYAPNFWLSLRSLDIHRVTFHAFDGQLVLDDFCFCF